MRGNRCALGTVNLGRQKHALLEFPGVPFARFEMGGEADLGNTASIRALHPVPFPSAQWDG